MFACIHIYIYIYILYNVALCRPKHVLCVLYRLVRVLCRCYVGVHRFFISLCRFLYSCPVASQPIV